MKKGLIVPIISLSFLLAFYLVAVYQRPINWYLRGKKADVIYNSLTPNTSLKKMPLDKVFFISLADNQERSEHIQEMAAFFHDTTTEAFPAVNGKKLSENDIASLENSKVLAKGISSLLSKGEIGCALSHRGVWQKIATDPTIDQALVLEDDAVIEENFEKKFREEVLGLGKQSRYHLFISLPTSNPFGAFKI